jgi:hypothetical protein
VSDETEIERLRRENDMLRGLLPALEASCAYCGLTDMAQCQRGFPGCAQADDLMCSNDETLMRLIADRREAREMVRRMESAMIGLLDDTAEARREYTIAIGNAAVMLSKWDRSASKQAPAVTHQDTQCDKS